MWRGRWLNPHVLVMIVCSGASHRWAVIRSAICSARFDIGSLDIDRADAELLVSEHAFKSICPVMLDKNRSAFDLADQVGLVAAGIKISMPDLPIIMRADRIVALADVDGHMDVFGKSLDRQIYCLDRGAHFVVARRRQIWLIDLDVLAARLGQSVEILV